MSRRQAALQEAKHAENASRAAALDLIARRRNQQGSRGIVGLDDSSDDEGRVPTRAQPVVLLDDSDDEDASENRTSNSSGGTQHSDPAPAKPLGRLKKKADVDRAAQRGAHSGDDLAAQLGGLTLNRATVSAQPPLRLPAVHVSRQLQQQVQDSSSEEEEEVEAEAAPGCLKLGDRGQFKLSAPLSKKLYPHQVDGVKWLWRLHESATGGILADDMGLGKTMQCSAFLSGLLLNKLIRRALVIAPKTLLAHWARELNVCGVGRMTHEYFGTESERVRRLDHVFRQRGVLLTTYGMVLHNAGSLAESDEHDPDDGPLWDVMILDEGHKIKNPRMQLRKHLDAVPARVRVIISGTPIQNNLQEMHTLFDFACPGLLGDARTFKDKYEKRITIGNDKHATQGERERGAVAAGQLRQIIAPFFLRREKKDVFSTEEKSSSSGEAEVPSAGDASKPASMGRKNDFIVWLRLKPMQRKVYEAFLNSDAVKAVFNQTNSALSALTVLKKICDHPALLSKRAEKGIVSGANRAKRLQLAGEESESEIESDSSGEGYYSSDEEEGRSRRAAEQKQKHKHKQPPQLEATLGKGEGGEWWDWAKDGASGQLLDEVHTTGFEASCKTVFVMALLHDLVKEGHRTLIFSQSRVMLNILEAAIKQEGWRFCRIDGSVASAQDREQRVKQFQTSDTIPIFLLTSQVGGLGLTLTAADRVIIVDPAWNPSTDNQAVDRAYRIGQSRDVVVYRLISCGTVEEKIYRKQVYKGGLSRTGTEDGEQFRYFSQQELRDLFRLDPAEAERSATQRALHDMHAHQRRATPQLSRHLQFLESLEGFAGVSDHDLLYSKKDKEAAPAAAPFGSQPPEAAAGLIFGSSQGPRQGSAIKKTATQGWSGAGDISDMFSRAMNLGGSSSAGAAAAVAPGRGAAPPPFGLSATLQIRRGADKDPQQERVEELEEKLRKQRALLASLGPRLPDGGAKVRALVTQLERELEAERAKLAGSSGSVAGPGGSSAGVGPGASASTDSASAASGAASGGVGKRPPPAQVPPRAQPGNPAHGGGTVGPVALQPASATLQPIAPSMRGQAVPAADLPRQQQQGPLPSGGSPAPAPSEPAGSGGGGSSSSSPRASVGTSAVAPAPAISPLRAIGAKLFGMATSVLGGGQQPAPPPGAGLVDPGARPKEEKGHSHRDGTNVIFLLSDDDAEPAAPPARADPTGAGALRGLRAGAAGTTATAGAGEEREPQQRQRGHVMEAQPATSGGGENSSGGRGRDTLEAHKQELRQLKKRVLKYATLLQQERANPQEPGSVAKLERKASKLAEEYKAAKLKYKMLSAVAVSLPADG